MAYYSCQDGWCGQRACVGGVVARVVYQRGWRSCAESIRVWLALEAWVTCQRVELGQDGRMGGVFVLTACQCGWREWRANVGSMLLLLLLLLSKCYPEEQNLKCLFLTQKEKMFQIDLENDLKKEPDLKSRCWFTLLGPVVQGSSICLNLLKYARMQANIPR